MAELSDADLIRIGSTSRDAPFLAVREAANALDALAPWCLHDELRDRRTGVDRPDLPASPGSCVVILARPNGLPFLAEAFPLPVRWYERKLRAADVGRKRLPPALAALGDQVVADLHNLPAVRDHTWGLQLHPEAGLSDLDLGRVQTVVETWESGWAALAVGLFGAAHGLPADPRVWVSAAHDPDFGARDVARIPTKLAAAVAWGAGQFWVADANYGEAIEAAAGLVHNPRDFVRQIAYQREEMTSKVLARLFAEATGRPAPPTDQVEDTHRAYYRLPHPTKKRLEYYFHDLLPALVREGRSQVQREWPGWRPSHFVTIVSDSPMVAAYGPAVLNAEKVLLLRSENTDEPEKTKTLEAHARRVESWLHEHVRGVECRTATFSNLDELEAEFGPLLSKFLTGADEGRIAFDLTPGMRSMSFALDALAPAGSWVVYLGHSTGADLWADPANLHYYRHAAGTPRCARLTLR